MPEPERARLETDLQTMVHWALSEETLREWLRCGLREPEVMDEKGQFKRLDLLVPGNEPIVVDFKTGQPTPKNAEQVLEYMDILDTMPDASNSRGFLVYLDLREIRTVGRDA